MREMVPNRALGRARRRIVGITALGIVASAMLLGACSTSAPKDQAAKDAEMGQQATLRAIGGSAISGKIRVIDRGDGAAVLLSVINFPYGPFRIAFHERGNCTSPNGFSAGPTWAPPSSGKRPEDLVPVQYPNLQNNIETELRIPNLHTTGVDGVAGRSVVLYYGTAVTEIVPDVPNSAMACGVFEVARPPSIFNNF